MVKQMHPKLIKGIGDRHLGFHWIATEVHDLKTQNDIQIHFYPLTLTFTYVNNERLVLGIGIFKYTINLEFVWYG
jgi:hypothetical protein